MCKIKLGLKDKKLNDVEDIVRRIHSHTRTSSGEQYLQVPGFGSSAVTSRTSSPITVSLDADSDHMGQRKRQWTQYSALAINDAPEAYKYVVALQGPTPTHSPGRLMSSQETRNRSVSSNAFLKIHPSRFISPATSPLRFSDGPMAIPYNDRYESMSPVTVPTIKKGKDEQDARLLMSLRQP